MAFTEDLDVFFDTDDFAVEATIKTSAGVTVRTINVILTSTLAGLEVLGGEVLAGQPALRCKTADLDLAPTVVLNQHKLTIGSTTYRIVDRADDGTGVSTLRIRA